MTWRESTSVALTLLLLLPGTMLSQRLETAFDAGGISVRYADSISATAAFLASSLAYRTGHTSMRARASLTQFARGNWTAQGGLAGSLYSPQRGPLLAEIGGSLAGNTHRSGAGSGEIRGGGRLHLSGRSVGAWLGAGGGRSWNRNASNSVLLGDVGVWARRAGASIAFFVNPFSVNDSTRYLDTQALANLVIRKVQLAGGIGVRTGDQLPALAGATNVWWSGSATIRVSRWMSLVASAGTYPVDYAQGFPGGRYASLAVRVPSLSSGNDVPPPVPEEDERRRAVDAGITAFSVRPLPGGEYLLRVRWRSEKPVEIAGDFSAWNPQKMEAGNGGWWSITLPLRPGSYQMNVRSEGGPWLVPPGLLLIKDEFGGAAGLLVVGKSH